MWESLKSKLLAILSFVAFLLFGVTLYEENKNKQLQTQLDEEKFKEKDQPLAQAVEQDKKVLAQEEQQVSQEKAPVAQSGTPDENTSYWNQKDSS